MRFISTTRRKMKFFHVAISSRFFNKFWPKHFKGVGTYSYFQGWKIFGRPIFIYIRILIGLYGLIIQPLFIKRNYVYNRGRVLKRINPLKVSLVLFLYVRNLKSLKCVSATHFIIIFGLFYSKYEARFKKGSREKYILVYVGLRYVRLRRVTDLVFYAAPRVGCFYPKISYNLYNFQIYVFYYVIIAGFRIKFPKALVEIFVMEK